MTAAYLPRGWARGFRPGHEGAVPRPVFGIDIDGTLGEYHAHFLRFAAPWLGVLEWPGPKAMRSDGLNLRWGHDEYSGDCPLHEFMGVSKATYRRIKLAYRQGGLKRSMPVWSGASDLTRALRARGAVVYICTTRPYLQVAGVEPDTREWLRRKGIQHDGVIAGEHKYRDLARLVGRENVVAVLDDLPELLGQAERLGIQPVMMMRPHNDAEQWCGEQEGRKAAAWSPDGACLKLMTELLDKWEENHR